MDSTFRGQMVVFTGRLASMTRRQAAEAVRAQGGKTQAAVTRGTTLVVVGGECWPLQRDGRLSNKLLRARLLQRRGQALKILTEDAFLDRLGLSSSGQRPPRHYSIADLGRILALPRDTLRAWLRAGLITPIETVQGIPCFDFQQVLCARTLSDLTRRGVALARIRRSLKQLSSWLAGPPSLGQLAAFEAQAGLLVRLKAGRLAEASGQLQLEFSEEDPQEALPLEPPPESRSAAEWFELGANHESAGRLEEAEKAYREALLAGGFDAATCFNLANVLAAQGKSEAAIERYRQAVETEPGLVEAWNNLGAALAEADRVEEALAAYQKALAIDPTSLDANFNLAGLLDQVGREQDACTYWRAYLKKDPQSDWARHARRRLYLAGFGS